MIGTPLDVLKQTVLRVENLIGVGREGITTCDGTAGNDHEGDQELLDSCRVELLDAVIPFVPGLGRDGTRLTYGGDAFRALRRYDDGSPIVVPVAVGDHLGDADFYPRLDGDLGAFRAIFGPTRHLHAVEDVEHLEPPC